MPCMRSSDTQRRHDALFVQGMEVYLLDESYSGENYIASVSPIPLLLIHGKADHVIPWQHSEKPDRAGDHTGYRTGLPKRDRAPLRD